MDKKEQFFSEWKKFKSLYYLLLFLVSNFYGFAQKTTDLPLLSSAAKVSQRFGVTDIEINYSRPKVKRRTIWGSLVPYGYSHPNVLKKDNSSPWRAGAENTTSITFSDTVTIKNTLVPKGKYSLFISVFKNNTAEIILNNAPRQFGSFFIIRNTIL